MTTECEEQSNAEKKRCLIIYNPVSGKGIDDEVIGAYHRVLQQNGYQADFVATRYSNHAVEVVANAKEYDVVFSIGGDGTLNEVVRGNFLRKKRLTICPLPSGTCNDVASMYGYSSKDPVKNLHLALDGEVHSVDIGTINDSPFAYVVGMGTFMNIPYETKSVEKRKQGYLAYLKGGIAELINKMRRYKAEVTLDGVRLDGSYSLIMISNANHIAGIDHFYRDVQLDDGQMEVLLCKSRTRGELLQNFVAFFLGQPSDKIISLKAHEVSIRLLERPEKNWCIDGEELKNKSSEYVISVKEKMSFLTPKIKTKSLFMESRNGV